MTWLKLLELVEDLHQVACLDEINVHVHDALVLGDAVQLQDEWVVQLAHPLYFIVQMRHLLVGDQLVFALELHGHDLVLGWHLFSFELLVGVA